MKPTKDQFVAAILKIERFSPAPRVLSKALMLLRDPNAEIDDIVTLIRADAALAADIIRGSNSAFYGAGERVSSLERALQKIGFREGIRLLNHAVAHLASGRNLGSYGIAAEDFWAESLFQGLFLEELARETAAVTADEAHTAGLLRYIGRLAINQSIDDLGGGLFWDGSAPVEMWEMENVGVTQEQAGAVLLKHWQFPDETVQAIEWQRAPAQAPQPNWIAEALEFAAAALPAGTTSAKLGDVLTATMPTLAEQPFAQANKLSAAHLAHVAEVARNGLSAVNQHLYG
ncbi:MAG TPA: HDOD domain-containing protein [Opitutaceae bacterium]|nr:HDOD domain-containing protein [Opitutaceae bacterium]